MLYFFKHYIVNLLMEWLVLLSLHGWSERKVAIVVLLEKVNNPSDLKKLTLDELVILSAEIREFLIERLWCSIK